MPRKKNTRPALTSIEPGTITVPTMDRASVAFAWFLDNMGLETDDSNHRLLLVCHLCETGICDVEVGDTLRVLLNTALAHDCTSHP